SWLPERERQLDGDQDRNRLAESRARRETPLLRGFDGFLIEAEDAVERSQNLHVAHRTVRPDDALEQHRALDLRAHGVGGVLRLHLAQHARDCDAVARTVRAAARSTTTARPETRSCSRANARPSAGSRAAASSGTLRERRRSRRGLDRAWKRIRR